MKDPQPPGWGICEVAAAALVGWTEAIPNLPVGVFTQFRMRWRDYRLRPFGFFSTLQGLPE